VARKTRETIVLFEAAGYDVIIVETVGVGQSEAQVRSMVDFFLLVLLAGAGDELQGFKRGVIELADAIAINKADGSNTAAAGLACAGFAGVLPYLQPATEGWQTRAFTCSAVTGEGLAELWAVVEAFDRLTRPSGAWQQRRGEQERSWVRELVREGLESRFRADAGVAASRDALEEEVVAGRLPATTAAQRLLDLFRLPPA
jgi:LAO/AO transport system kinase